jgi:osmotically-inducible protein OsmY
MKVTNFCRHLIAFSLILFCSACASLHTSSCTASCTDADITTNIQVKLAADRCLRHQDIDVSSYERVVTLNGSVENPTQRSVAIQYAKSVANVKRVISHLTIRRNYQ